jgi:hypothetical protein
LEFFRAPRRIFRPLRTRLASSFHEVGSVAGLRLLYDALWAAFPDAKATIEDLVAGGDKLAYGITYTRRT